MSTILPYTQAKREIRAQLEGDIDLIMRELKRRALRLTYEGEPLRVVEVLWEHDELWVRTDGVPTLILLNTTPRGLSLLDDLVRDVRQATPGTYSQYTKLDSTVLSRLPMKEVLARRAAYDRIKLRRRRQRDQIFADIRSLDCTVLEGFDRDNKPTLDETLIDHAIFD